MITVFRSRRVLPLSLALLCALACSGSAARADYASDTQFLNSVRAVLDAKEGTPAERLARAQEMAKTAQISAEAQINLANNIAGFQRHGMGDRAGALQTLEAGLAQHSELPRRFVLVGQKIDILVEEDPDAAASYARAQWALAQKGDPEHWGWLVTPSLKALRLVADDQGAVAMLKQAWAGNLRNLGNYKGQWMTRERKWTFDAERKVHSFWFLETRV